MPRQPKLDVPGTLHHVIGRGIEGSKIFWNRGDREDFLDRLVKLSEAKALNVYGGGCTESILPGGGEETKIFRGSGGAVFGGDHFAG